ncbi:Hint domain-containing protein [Ketogulonicigenium vulgare]|uniref:Hint domain-containing protein n=1 Tax=Ketogulonicigenium vulgare TaxID=92945 RepID=UPI0023599A9A|nr:Hint domain-containing protein [Ketogulonicigenium vulgare]
MVTVIGNGGTLVIDQSNVNDVALLDLQLLGSATIIVDGVDFEADSLLLSAGVLSNITWEAKNGANLTVDAGLIGLDALVDLNFNIYDDSSISYIGATVSLAGVLQGPIDVNYYGAEVGTFLYDPAVLGVVSATTFNVGAMGPFDQFIVSGVNMTQGAYAGGVLPLTGFSGLLPPILGETIRVNVAMTAAEYGVIQNPPAGSGIGLVVSGGNSIYTDPCFAQGTLIRTERGDLPVEQLRAGDLVLTADAGYQPIKWAGQSYLSATDLDQRPNMTPVRIAQGALGANLPMQDLIVSPQHRMLVNGTAVHGVTGHDEAFVAAKHLVGLDGVVVAKDMTEVTYYHILLDAHAVIMSNGAPSESFYLGDFTRRTLNPRLMEEIRAIEPKLQDADFLPEMARPALTGAEARAVIADAAGAELLVAGRELV